MVHTLEDTELLAPGDRVVRGKMRRYYALTARGISALNKGRERAVELLDEILDATIEMWQVERYASSRKAY